VFKSRALPPHLDDNALICISLPDKAKRSLAKAKRGGKVYEIVGRCVVVSARDPPLDPPPVTVVRPRPSAVAVKYVGSAAAAGRGPRRKS